MIGNFADSRTQIVFHGKCPKGFPGGILGTARRKLDMLNRSKTIADLRNPPGNRLEALKGDLEGFYSIRVNEQWRIVFRWRDGTARDVRIVDYH